LPKDESQKVSTPTVAELKKSDEQTQPLKAGPAVADKSAALENASLSELAADKATESSKAGTSVSTKKEEPKKLTIGQKIKKELLHYWDGTKLLAAEVKISSRLALKMAAGYELSRRENRQVGTCISKLAA